MAPVLSDKKQKKGAAAAHMNVRFNYYYSLNLFNDAVPMVEGGK